MTWLDHPSRLVPALARGRRLPTVMDRNASALLAPLHQEVAAVLAVLTAVGPEERVRLNDISAGSSLPTGHVGRHLRTLERDRLVRYSAGAWQATLRGMRYAAVQPGEAPAAADTPAA